MDLRRHLNVLWRFRVIVAAGVGIGILLAVVALVSLPGFEWRQQLVHSSTSQLYVTQPGFPEGRVLADDADVVPGAEAGEESADTESAAGAFFADPARFSDLALLYSYLLSSDELTRRIPDLPKDSEILAGPVVNGTGSRATTLPLMNIETRAADPGEARRLNTAAIKALSAYVDEQLDRENVPQTGRVQLMVLSAPSEPVVAVGRSYTGAIVLFILCAMFGVGVAYVLENLRPARRSEERDWMPETWQSPADQSDVPRPAENDLEPDDPKLWVPVEAR